MEQEALWEKARAYFKKQLAAFIELPVQRIESSASLEDYGIDSIMAIHFTNALEHSFGPLSKTLLFEHLTINSVTEYFLHNYLDQLRNVLGSEELGATTLPQATQKNNGTRWSFTRQT